MNIRRTRLVREHLGNASEDTSNFPWIVNNAALNSTGLCCVLHWLSSLPASLSFACFLFCSKGRGVSTLCSVEFFSYYYWQSHFLIMAEIHHQGIFLIGRSCILDKLLSKTSILWMWKREHLGFPVSKKSLQRRGSGWKPCSTGTVVSSHFVSSAWMASQPTYFPGIQHADCFADSQKASMNERWRWN